MDPLENRIIFREVNERIWDVNASLFHGEEVVELFCECGRRDCLERIEVPASLYERVRAAARQYLLADGHQVSGRDRVVEAGAAYLVVA